MRRSLCSASGNRTANSEGASVRVCFACGIPELMVAGVFYLWGAQRARGGEHTVSADIARLRRRDPTHAKEKARLSPGLVVDSIDAAPQMRFGAAPLLNRSRHLSAHTTH